MEQRSISHSHQTMQLSASAAQELASVFIHPSRIGHQTTTTKTVELFLQFKFLSVQDKTGIRRSETKLLTLVRQYTSVPLELEKFTLGDQHCVKKY
jgi:hypothetical protein